MTKFKSIDIDKINLQDNIETKIIGDQFIITDGKYMISINDKYIVYVGNNNGPEKILLNISKKGYYEISNNNNKGLTYKEVPKPEK
jgi:hypothetical protein